MKLLLTSAGLTNKTIINGLQKLLGKPIKNTKLAYIPTAANVEEGDKSWLIKDLNNCIKAGFEVDIVDISAVSKDIWLPRLKTAKVLLFGGGKTMHLMYWLNKSGLTEILPELLKSKIYVGISAGSCVACPTIFNSVQNLFDEEYPLKIKKGLNFVNFQFIPHLNSPYFSKIRKNNLEKASKKVNEPVYIFDDNSALVFDNGKIEIASEGEWYKFN
jgi:dipeptidase E